MAFPFEFAIDGPPVSQQTRRRDRLRAWVQEVHEAAKRGWRGTSPFDGMLLVNITYIFDTVDLDIDNICKPILDAMKDLIYVDDIQIVDLNCRKRHYSQGYDAVNSSDLFDNMIERYTEFTHVRVSLANGPEASDD